MGRAVRPARASDVRGLFRLQFPFGLKPEFVGLILGLPLFLPELIRARGDGFMDFRARVGVVGDRVVMMMFFLGLRAGLEVIFPGDNRENRGALRSAAHGMARS